uniref:Uncharacterized protein n=1 Tax=Acrobeloides nanus TaxID=290746 RepID=A0A914DNJ8_9BILA
MKLTGYSETAWDWELLFLVVDSIAVLSLIFGVSSEHAAFLQPFVILSIITISFLILLIFYLGSAIYDPHSYAGESMEVQFHEPLTNIAQHFKLELKHMVSISAGICAFVLLISVTMHCWFVVLTVKCAKYFRELEAYKKRLSNEIISQRTDSRQNSKRIKAKTP